MICTEMVHIVMDKVNISGMQHYQIRLVKAGLLIVGVVRQESSCEAVIFLK